MRKGAYRDRVLEQGPRLGGAQPVGFDALSHTLEQPIHGRRADGQKLRRVSSSNFSSP